MTKSSSQALRGPQTRLPFTATRQDVTPSVVSYNKYPLLNDAELLSLNTLMSCVARVQKIERKDLESMLEAEFSIDELAQMRRHDLYHAMELLINLRSDEVDHFPSFLAHG